MVNVARPTRSRVDITKKKKKKKSLFGPCLTLARIAEFWVRDKSLSGGKMVLTPTFLKSTEFWHLLAFEAKELISKGRVVWLDESFQNLLIFLVINIFFNTNS